MDIYTILSSIPHNPHYLKRYIKFIRSCESVILSENTYTEKHHICPKYLFPNYKDLNKNPWNCSVLTKRQHFIAHWILAKTYGGLMISAFCLMGRLIDRNTEAYTKTRQAQLISDEVRFKISKAMKEYYKHNDNPRKGKKCSKESIQKQLETKRKNNKPVTAENRAKRSKSISKLKWYNNGKESKRLNPDNVPDGWVPGRFVNFTGKSQPKATEETKLKMREARSKTPRIPCKYCGEKITPQNIKRHEKRCERISNKKISETFHDD